MNAPLLVSAHKLDELLRLGLPLPEGLDPRAKNANGQDLLAQAASCGLERLCQALLPQAGLCSRDAHGMGALHLAARAGSLACVELLLPHFNPAEAALSGRCPLMHAAQARSAPCVRALLRAGADPSRRSRGGWSALMWAAKALSPEAFEALLPVSDPGLRNEAGQNAFDIARQQAEREGVKPGSERWALWEATEIRAATRAPGISAPRLSFSL